MEYFFVCPVGLWLAIFFLLHVSSDKKRGIICLLIGDFLAPLASGSSSERWLVGSAAAMDLLEVLLVAHSR